MPVEVIVSESAKPFAERMNFDPSGLIWDLLGIVPKADRMGLAKVVVADVPPRKKVRNPQALASYFRAFNGNPARVEVYIRNVFGYLKGPESLALMLPFAQIGLAGTLFHEVGHHVQHTRSHGVHRGKAEQFAETYAKQLLGSFVLSRVDSVKQCIAQLERLAEEKSVSPEKLASITHGWDKEYAAALAAAAAAEKKTR